MLESLGSKIENQGKRPLEEEDNPIRRSPFKCHKLGYELRKQKAPTFNGIIKRGNEVESWLVNIERHMMLYDFNPLEKTKFS
jgi:hypothetical protein